MNAYFSFGEKRAASLRLDTTSERHFVGIQREPKFTLGVNDAALMERVVHGLLARGYTSALFRSPEDALTHCLAFEQRNPRARLTIFNMCRDQENLQTLSHFASAHQASLVNTPESTKRVMRKPLYTLMKRHEVPLPETHFLSLNEVVRRADELFYPIWLKLPGHHHIDGHGVQRVENAEALRKAVQVFWQLRQSEVVVQRDLSDGEELKFYGVYSLKKETLIYLSDTPQLSAAQRELLRKHSMRLAKASGIQVFGGDCFTSEGNQIHIVDFNSWPSFGFFAKDGAAAIVEGMLIDNF